ncbi:ABC transporter ATP-binding protein [Candidatus Dojkabacteria bacterium]|jgi:lipopolysaccharide transport system ATP-binding protein|nr:ABC transporter ATP-binding protein [Candidatus Dojkabacteria bacterium]
MEKAIEVKNLGKKYSLGERERYLTLRDMFVKTVKVPGNLLKGKKFRKKSYFWALKNVSFDVNKGEVIGIIGKNGAGKSTILKILSRITEPTEGEIIMRGTVSSLLEVGTGFHSELTGRENIYLNGAILGMSRKEIDKKFDEIVEFSGVEKFLELPMKKFSSGMQVRLAFSVAAHLEPDILIIDEVLSVGDAEFQRKSLGKMDEVVKKDGRTILFVSHDMSAVQRLCPKTIWLENGEIKFMGNTQEAISKYIESTNGASSEYEFENDTSKIAKILKIKVTDDKGNPVTVIDNDQEFKVEYTYQVNLENSVIHSAVILENPFGVRIFASGSTDKSSNDIKPKKKGIYSVVFTYPKTTGAYVNPGTYWLRVNIGTPNSRPVDYIENIPITFKNPEGDKDNISSNRISAIKIDSKWDL